MSLWFDAHVNTEMIGRISVRRLRYLDLTDKAAIADEVSDYEVRLDGKPAGQVSHRYGDGAWVLLHKALGVIVQNSSQ